MTQLHLLFGVGPRARRRDPETSQEAATRAHAVAPTHRNIIMAALDRPQTTKELSERTGLDYVKVARRMCELEELGLAKATEDRRDGCRVWVRGANA